MTRVRTTFQLQLTSKWTGKKTVLTSRVSDKLPNTLADLTEAPSSDIWRLRLASAELKSLL